MIIECPNCSAFVDGKVLGQKEYGADEYGDPRKVVLIECPTCDSALLGRSEIYQTEDGDWDWSRPTRLWPKAVQRIHQSIPSEIGKALKDANRCFEVKVYSASAVMAGRAIEAMCKDKVGSGTLAKGLEKMKNQGIIDQKIWDWADALRQERNLGAHATGADVTEQDAKDVLDFANAICEYVYVLTEQFDEYMARKG